MVRVRVSVSVRARVRVRVRGRVRVKSCIERYELCRNVVDEEGREVNAHSEETGSNETQSYNSLAQSFSTKGLTGLTS